MKVRYVWYDNMYYGQSVSGHKFRTKIKVSAGREGFNTYLLTIPEGDCNMLDIIHSTELKQPVYDGHTKYVVGIASGKDEAINLVKNIIEDCYKAIGKIDLREFFDFGPSCTEVN